MPERKENLTMNEEYLKRKRAYICRHRRICYKTISVDFRYDTEGDVIDFLNAQPSKQKFIKEAIKEAIAKAK